MDLLQLLKQPRVWAFAAPAIFALVALWTLSAFAGARDEFQRTRNDRDQVLKYATQIERLRDRTGSAQTASRLLFDGKASAGQAAQAAGIPLDRLARGESSAPRRLRDGRILHSETYHLRGVRLLHAARFIDFAESNFASVATESLTLTPLPGRDDDAWDVTIRLRYLEESPAATDTVTTAN